MKDKEMKLNINIGHTIVIHKISINKITIFIEVNEDYDLEIAIIYEEDELGETSVLKYIDMKDGEREATIEKDQYDYITDVILNDFLFKNYEEEISDGKIKEELRKKVDEIFDKIEDVISANEIDVY